ncbi:MAG: single-stranded-DNA-specific exonuclease RecJ [Bacteroidales bacterium]|nr:single-stranded-DNA-specific exonuclease RecJ [Bacteroidales bacterium]MCF8332778.1 single-stranded-DNA-specific exonuclease RecJ [Bacteroidales bacterium]
MEKRWLLKKEGESEHVEHLSKVLNIDHNLANLLVQRQIYTFDEAKNFFRPELSQLHDPFLMKDMDRTINRIEMAIQRNERILIYGDYDVDGTTAVALMYTFLSSIYLNIDYYIPDRYTEGYGVSYKGVDYACENGISLIIALDCGIKAVDKVKYATEKGIDFIIGDHHRPDAALPNAYAILDPKRPDCNYPYPELSGCGVAFKIVQAYAQQHYIPFRELEKYLDLVVVSIAADIVPVTGENRILAFHGLKLMNTNPRPGFEAILRYSNIHRKGNDPKARNNYIFHRELTITDMVFLIGPRINAAGRIESGNNSVELLISDDIEYARHLAEQINDFNIERRNLDAKATQQAQEMIKSEPGGEEKKTTVVYDPDWHKGVVGIVASRLIEKYYRPTIVLTKSNGLITGSARSIKNFDVYDAIDACSDLLEHFGGHKYAAGLSLRPENFEPFKERFEDIVGRSLRAENMVPEIEIDANLHLKDINSKFFRILRQFAPFGPGNEAPIFRTCGVIDTGYIRLIKDKHLKMAVIHPRISGFPIEAIAFQQGKHFEYIKNSNPFDICYSVEENEMNGMLQLNIKDIKPAET